MLQAQDSDARRRAERGDRFSLAASADRVKTASNCHLQPLETRPANPKKYQMLHWCSFLFTVGEIVPRILPSSFESRDPYLEP
jgi:hypothetical protein